MSSDERDDPRFFRLARAILRGQRHDERDIAVAKMLSFVLDERGSDVWIEERAIKLRFAGQPTVHHYFVALAPGVVWDLMGRLGASRIESPSVGTLRASGARLPAYIRSRSPGDMIGWIAPKADQIVVHTRPIGEAGECELQAIPDSGPWALPSVAGPIEPGRQRVFVSFAEAMPSPHCRASSSSYRQLRDGSLVCATCGRSFDSD